MRTAGLADASVAPGELGVVARAERLAPLIAAAGPEIDATRRLPPSLVDALHEARLFRVLMPASVDGEEADGPAFLEMLEIVGRADASTAWCLAQTSVCSTAAAFLRHEVAQAIFAPARALVAWGYGTTGRAIPVDGGYRISGTWHFGSGTHHATWVGGGCSLCDASGTPLRDGTGRPVSRMMLFPHAEARFTDAWDVIGLRGTGSDSYEVADLFIPDGFLFQFGALPQPHARGVAYIMPADALWGPAFAAVALGVAQAALAAFVVLAQEKTPRAFKRPLAESAGAQMLVARSDARLRAARHFLMASFAEVWAAATATRTVDLDARMTIRLAASHAIAEARDVVTGCYHAAGTTAVFAANPFERRLRDMHTISQHIHGRESHFENVGQYMLGLQPDLAFL